MKIIDKFLKKLNTDRNTFATFILTLITIYLVIDRIVEMLLMIFTGVSYSYWGPIMYTFALACPIFAYVFSIPSKFVNNKVQQVAVFDVFTVAFYIIAVSMFTQWLNESAWLLLLSVPGYTDLITNFSELITPAFSSLSLYLPLASIFPFFSWLYMGVHDTKDEKRSIWDYTGIDLSDKKVGHGPYTCEVYLCTDNETAKKIVFPEVSRFQSLFVCGGSGSGKTSLVFEPMIAKDIERKSFFREVSKELGFTALKTKIAYLNVPYDNEYLNHNFKLSMLKPIPGKEKVFKAFCNKMILGKLGDDTVYRDLGLTLIAPDYEVIEHSINICNNFGVSYDIVDPYNSSTIGLNPFVYDDANKIATMISDILRTLFANGSKITDTASQKQDFVIQTIENLVILLKEMYPRMNEGAIPNLEDLLMMLTNFDMIEKMCKIMATNDELNEKYKILLAYFKKNFYNDSSNAENMKEYLSPIVNKLDSLLRIPGIKAILCNRYNNINFDESLAQGKFLFICTRRGDLGASSYKSFGLYCLISLQNAVLRRPGNENNRIPHFLYIDEFSDFICKATEPIFTMFRKYRVGTTISTQSLSQLEGPEKNPNYRTTILANCASKIFTGNGDVKELEWWSKEFGKKRDWTYSSSMDTEKGSYDKKLGNVKWDWTDYFAVNKLQSLGQKSCAYKIRGSGGKPMIGQGDFKYVESKYKEPQKVKVYDYGKYSDSVTTATEDAESPRKKFNLKNLDFTDDRNEVDPIQTDTSDSKYLFNSEDAIIVNLKKGNPNGENK